MHFCPSFPRPHPRRPNHKNRKVRQTAPRQSSQPGIPAGVEVSDGDQNQDGHRRHGQRRPAPVGGAAGVGHFDGHEMQDGKCRHQQHVAPVPPLEDEDHVKGRHVPHDGEADEVVIVGYHAFLAVVDGRHQQDEESGGQVPGAVHQAGRVDHVGRHDGVGREVDDEIDALAADVGQHFRHPEAAGEGAVDAVDQLGGEQPEHGGPEIAGADRQDGQKNGEHAGSGEEVDAPGEGFFCIRWFLFAFHVFGLPAQWWIGRSLIVRGLRFKTG